MANPRVLREQIITCLRQQDFASLVRLAGEVKGVPEQLLGFLYDPTDILYWRAMEGLGEVAAADPPQVRRVINRLLYLLNEDSGSTGWGAAAALGEIGRRQLAVIVEIIPMFCGFLEQKFSRGPMLWGIGRLAAVHPEALEEVTPFILPCLQEAEAEVRGLAAWCAGRLNLGEAKEGLLALLNDHRQVQVYDQGQINSTTVSRLAEAALAALRPAGV